MGKRKRSGSFSKYDECSKKSDDGDSQEELDGESGAAQKGNIVNGIRYSARVQEKQEKLRREASPSKQTVVELAPTSTTPIPCQTTLKPIIGDDPEYIFPFETNFISHSISSGEKKKKRTWELWSQEDKQLFFEALNEFGKDFDSIQNYLASKLKPRSKASCAPTVPKNKDQVRHFYYRTWNKISKYLTFPKDMKKAYQELYGLINYGELRKKQRVLNLKSAVKLSELVERGTTTIKVRGKTFRIKTPVCRALKKLNQLEETDNIRVPCKLCVELVPHDGNTWTSVQRVSHNPRVKIYVPLQRTLSSLIIYFEERWKTDHNRLKEEFSLTMFGKPRTRLRFIPVESRDLSVPLFKFSEVTSATKISLSSYVQNCLSQNRKDDSLLNSKKFKRKPKLDSDNCSGNAPHRDSDYLAAEADVSDADGCEANPENQFRITLRRDKFQFGSTLATIAAEAYMDQDNSNGFQDNNMWSVHEENANAATETDVGETDYGFDENIPSPTECDENTDDDCLDPGMQEQDNDIDPLPNDNDREDKQGTCAACRSPEIEECGTPEKMERQCTCGGKKGSETIVNCPTLDAETIAKGWNADDAGALTVGEIYLMLGKSDKLCFEYTWDKCEEDKVREERGRNLVDKLISVARNLKKRKTNRAKTTSISINPLGTSKDHVCSKCKTESVVSVESDSLATAATAMKDSCESPNTDSSPRSTTAQPETSDESKITLHGTQTITVAEPPEMPEPAQNQPLENPLPLESCEPIPVPHEALDVKPYVNLETDLEQKEDESASSSIQGKLRTENVAYEPEPIIPVTTTCTTAVITTSIGTATSGIIELTTLDTVSTIMSEFDCSFRRATPSITATMLPQPPTIIRSIASLTNNSFHDVQKTTLCSTLSPVTATTTVLVSEPAVFAGLADSPSFVAIQSCTQTPTSVLPKAQDSKFRRPADIPILMKPSTEERSTNEDGSPKVNVPKPFLDLPKGNRRIGRRPAWKQRVIIPRMLPLLPKPDENMLKSATMATIIAIPPVVATGLSVVSDGFTPVVSLSTADLDIRSTSTTFANVTTLSSSSLASTSASIVVSSIPAITSARMVTSSMVTSVPVTTVSTSRRNLFTEMSPDKSNSKNLDGNQPSSSSRAHASGFEETLDSLSLSSFMDISIPESTRFIASDLRLEELECSNTSGISMMSGMLDESRRNARDPPLLFTPKKQSSDDVLIETPSPRIPTLDTSWSNMNESSDLFMGGLFSGNETLRPSSDPLSEGDINFQSVMGENSLDFESKLRDFTVHITDSNKD